MTGRKAAQNTVYVSCITMNHAFPFRRFVSFPETYTHR